MNSDVIKRVEQHAMNAGDCPPQSKVVLLGSLRRIFGDDPRLPVSLCAPKPAQTTALRVDFSGCECDLDYRGQHIYLCPKMMSALMGSPNGPEIPPLYWPESGRFSVQDMPGEHQPCYLIMPSGGMIPFVHHAENGVDQARAKFLADAGNSALTRNESGETLAHLVDSLEAVMMDWAAGADKPQPGRDAAMTSSVGILISRMRRVMQALNIKRHNALKPGAENES